MTSRDEGHARRRRAKPALYRKRRNARFCVLARAGTPERVRVGVVVDRSTGIVCLRPLRSRRPYYIPLALVVERAIARAQRDEVEARLGTGAGS